MKKHCKLLGSRLALVSFLVLGLAGSSQAQFGIGLYKDGKLVDSFTNTAPAPAAASQVKSAGAAAPATQAVTAPAVSADAQKRNEVFAQSALMGLQIQEALRQMQGAGRAALVPQLQPRQAAKSARAPQDQQLRVLLQQFIALQDETRAALYATGARVLEMHLPQEILQRQLDSIAAFESGLAQFTNAVNDVVLGKTGALDTALALMEQFPFRHEPDFTKASPTRVPMQIKPAPQLTREQADALLPVQGPAPAKAEPGGTRTSAIVPIAAPRIAPPPPARPVPALQPMSGGARTPEARSTPDTARPAAKAEAAQRSPQLASPLNTVTRNLSLPVYQAPTLNGPSAAQAPPAPASPVEQPLVQPLGSPSPADSAFSPPTTADLAPTVDVQMTAEITNKAVALGNSPLAIHEFVRNNIAFQPYLGSRKGSVETLHQRAGNDTDQASLLLALLRAAGIPCRYVRGSVEMTPDQAKSWLGVDDAHTAGGILTTAGLDGVNIMNGGTVVAVRCTRVWVEAYVPYSNYRGIPNDDTGKTWIPLDPAFKNTTITPGEDVLTPMGFNTETFLANYISTYRSNSPIEVLQQDVQTWLNVNRPGKKVADIERKVASKSLALGLLPASLPYNLLSLSSRFSELEDTKRFKVRFQLYDGGTAFIDYTAYLSQLAGRQVSINYVGATPADQATIDAHGGIFQTPPNLVRVKPVLSVDDSPLATSVNSIGMGYTHNSDMYFTQPAGDQNQQPVIYNNIIAGNSQAICFDTFLDFHNPFLNTTNAPTDTLLPSQLRGTAADYLNRIDRGEERVAGLMRIVLMEDVSEVIAESSVNVTFSGGVPTTFQWNGMTVDADRRIIGPFAVNGDSSKNVPFMLLSGYDGSVMENRVFEDNYSQRAVSTIKILQLANDAGVGVCTINSAIGSDCPGFSQPSSVTSSVNDALARGHHVIIPKTPITVGQWSGTGYIDLDPATGAAGYIISGGISGSVSTAGGATVDSWDIDFTCVFDSFTGNVSWPPADSPDPNAVFCADDDTPILFIGTVTVHCKNGSSQTSFLDHQMYSPWLIAYVFGPGDYELTLMAIGQTKVLRKISIVKVEFAKDEATACWQAGGTFDAKALLTADSEHDDSRLKWSISPNTTGASINSSGQVSLGSEGASYTIFAEHTWKPGCSAAMSLQAIQLVIKADDGVSAPARYLCVNGNKQYKAVLKPFAVGTFFWNSASPVITLSGTSSDTVTVQAAGNPSSSVDVEHLVVNFIPTTGSSACSDNQTLTVVKMEVKRLDFTSDHGVLTDYNSDYVGSGGTVYDPRGWVKGGFLGLGANNPITHTRGTSVSATITIDFRPAGVSFALEGDSAVQSLTFHKSGLSSTGGDQQVDLTSDGLLPSSVGIIEESVNWSIAVNGGPTCTSDTTGPHKIFVLCGPPGEGPTLKRITRVVTECNGLSAEAAIVERLWEKVAGPARYVLGSPYPDPEWAILDNTPGECIAIANLFKKTIEMIGLTPGDGTVKFLYVDESGGSHESDLTTAFYTRECQIGKNGHTASIGQDHSSYKTDENLVFEDQGTGPGSHWNNWEACYKYRNNAGSPYKWYAAGTGGNPAYTSVQEVMNDITKRTAWVFSMDASWGVVGFCISPGPFPEHYPYP